MFRKKKETEYYEQTFDTNIYFEQGGNAIEMGVGADDGASTLDQIQNLPLSYKILFCIVLYIIFLMCGVFSTEFILDDAGVNQPQVIPLSMRDDLADYKTLRKEFVALNNFVGDIEKIDSSLDNAIANKFEITTRYQTLVSNLDSKIVNVKALPVDDKYSSLVGQMAGIYNTAGSYIQKITGVLTQGGDFQTEEIMEARHELYKDFLILQDNMKVFAEMVKQNETKFFNSLSGKTGMQLLENAGYLTPVTSGAAIQ